MTAARGHEGGARDRAWAIVHDPYDMDRPGVPLVTVPRDALVDRIAAALQAAVQDVERRHRHDGLCPVPGCTENTRLAEMEREREAAMNGAKAEQAERLRLSALLLDLREAIVTLYRESR